MKVAVIAPFGLPRVVGGAERLWTGLVQAINTATDHDAELVEVFSPESTFAEVLSSYQTFDLLDVARFDVVVSGKYPAWMVRHPRHIVHMCHPLRGLYDTYDKALPTIATPASFAGRDLRNALLEFEPGDDGRRHRILALAAQLSQSLPPDHPDLAFPGPLIRSLVQWLDADALHPRNVAAHLAISRTVANRPGYFPAGVTVDVVVPPSGLAGLHEGPYRDFFTASRLDHPKRVHLLIDAMKFVPATARLRIAGTGPAEAELRVRAAGDSRISFLGRLSDEALVEEYASALAVPFVPQDEDLGLITLEAQMSGKPVITCTDSGGTTDLVEHGVDGFVVEPSARALARAMTEVLVDPGLAERMGQTGHRRAAQVTWTTLVNELLRPRTARAPRRRPRGKVVVLSTYSAFPARHGGQVRVNRLFSALGRDHDVHLVAPDDGYSQSGEVSHGFWQTIVPQSHVYQQLSADLSRLVGAPAGDIAATLAGSISNEYADVANALARTADVIVLPHPYLYPLVRELDRAVPLVYDAHNAEWRLKRDMYPSTAVGQALADAVMRVETALLMRSRLVTTVSDEDRDDLRALAGTLADFEIVPNGGDFSTTPFTSGNTRRELRSEYLRRLRANGLRVAADEVAVFVGSGHPPNIEAARCVLETARTMPDVLFILLGSHVPKLGGEPLGGNVIARGIVERNELELLLSLCSVALNPMRTGSGTNIKMLDYFAAGAPAVSSPTGARGLPIEDGRELLLAEGDELVAAIRRTIDRPEEADARAVAARHVAQPFDWATLGQRFAALVSRQVHA